MNSSIYVVALFSLSMRKKRGNGEKGNRGGFGIELGKLIKVLMIRLLI
jgi:hypothetical protein